MVDGSQKSGEVAATGGRRRAQLLQRAQESSTRTRLTVNDVEALRSDASAAQRARVAAKLGHQYDELSERGAGDLADTVLGLILRDRSIDVRQSLALAVAASKRLPHDSLLALARDEIEVAEPVLARSPRLREEDIRAILTSKSAAYGIPIASRQGIREPFADMLVATADTAIVRALLLNQSAQVSDELLARVLRDHAHDEGVANAMAGRTDLPYEIVETLVAIEGRRIEWPLVEEKVLGTNAGRAIQTAARESSRGGGITRDQDDRKRLAELRELFPHGVEIADILRALREGDISNVEIGMASRSKFDLRRTRRLLYEEDRLHLAALCLRAGFNAPQYLLARMAIEIAMSGAHDEPVDSFPDHVLTFLQREYENLRGDKIRMHQLIRT